MYSTHQMEPTKAKHTLIPSEEFTEGYETIAVAQHSLKLWLLQINSIKSPERIHSNTFPPKPPAFPDPL